MAQGGHFSVARNKEYSRSAVQNMERHNERQNESYSNVDVVLAQSHKNIKFKDCEGGYLETLDRLLEDKTVSTRGLKLDATVIDELIFDVNTMYFEENGGYDFAVKFYREAYNYAVKKIGGEEFILSAVMHADEINRMATLCCDDEVYHYHLHVVYLPVVKKEVRYSKRCKDVKLRGTVKEVVNQISHSKKWASDRVKTDNGKTYIKYSYSALQDEFFHHMTEKGFAGFERGKRGSDAEHLEVTDYKVAQNERRITEQEAKIAEQSDTLSKVEARVDTAKKLDIELQTIENIGKKKRFSGKVELTSTEYDYLIESAKNGVALQQEVFSLKKSLEWLKNEISNLQLRYDNLLSTTKEFRDALKLAPQLAAKAVRDVITSIKEKEQAKQVDRLRHQTPLSRDKNKRDEGER